MSTHGIDEALRHQKAIIRSAQATIEALTGDEPIPVPEPPPGQRQNVYYWNGTHDPNTFGHGKGIPMARRGIGNVRTYYEAEQGLYRPGTGQFKADGDLAKAAGCSMWVWDIEIGALFGLTPGQAAAGIAEVLQSIPVGLAPKIAFGHFYGWRGQTTWKMSPAEALKWAMDAGVTGLFDWHYSASGQQFADVFAEREGRGFKGVQCAIMEPRRTWDGNRPATAQDVRAVYNAGYSAGWFSPPSWRGQPIDYSQSEGMAEARRLYR